jgi:hypothetical protein
MGALCQSCLLNTLNSSRVLVELYDVWVLWRFGKNFLYDEPIIVFGGIGGPAVRFRP